MSDISPTSGTAKDPAEIYRLVRERFAPMARFGGPLYAGIYSSHGISGGLYVGELNQWLWVPETTGGLGPEDALLSDEQVAAARFSGHPRKPPSQRETSLDSHGHFPT